MLGRRRQWAVLLAATFACASCLGSAAEGLREAPDHVPGSRSGGGSLAAPTAAATAVAARRSLQQQTRASLDRRLQDADIRERDAAAEKGGSGSEVDSGAAGSAAGDRGSAGRDSSVGESGQRCPQLSKELLLGRARNASMLMFAVANERQWDFAQNWLHFIQKTEIDYYVIAAADLPTSRRLREMGEPCFEWIDEEIPKLGLEWGQEGWRRMTWAKVFILDAVVDWGLDLVVSDLDVVWFRDPAHLLQQYPNADLIFSTDGTHTFNAVGDGGLSLDGCAGQDFNTGVYLLRGGNQTAAWAHAWRAFYAKCPDHDQMCAYEVTRKGECQPHPLEPRLQSTWDGRLYTGMLPPTLAMNAHTLFLQELHKVNNVTPYVVHLTWTYNGVAGKRARMRDLRLWADPPAYYSQGSFVTVDLQLPQPPLGYNKWNENEDMISFHLDWIHRQLQQAYVGMALATAAGRAFILPKFQCYCEKIWYGVVRCRVVSAQDMPLPVPCPQDYLFQPANYGDDPQQYGTPLNLREASFLENERTLQDIKDSVLVIQPSAALDCRDCVREERPPPGEGGGNEGEGGPLRLLVPPALQDTQLLSLLAPYRSYRVWRLSFQGVGSTQRAYAGFSRKEAAEAFDRRMAHVTTDFCCRREEEAPRYHKEQQVRPVLSMTSEFSYSGSFSGGGGGGGGSSSSSSRSDAGSADSTQTSGTERRQR